MKYLVITLLTLISFSGFSQEITFPKKFQPVSFGQTAYRDTMFIDTASMYNSVGFNFQVDTTADGRYFLKAVDAAALDTINGNLVIEDTLKVDNAQITALSGSGIYVSVDGSGNLYKNNIDDSVKSYIADSSFWLNQGTWLEPQSSDYDRLFIGASNGGSIQSTTAMQVSGQFNKTSVPVDLSTDTIIDASTGVNFKIEGSGNVSAITNAEVGTMVTFSVAEGMVGELEPAYWTDAGLTLKVPSGVKVSFDEFDVFEIIYLGDEIFLLKSISSNQ